MLFFFRKAILDQRRGLFLGQRQFRIPFRGNLSHPVHEATGARRDQAANDNVLLETLKLIDPA